MALLLRQPSIFVILGLEYNCYKLVFNHFLSGVNIETVYQLLVKTLFVPYSFSLVFVKTQESPKQRVCLILFPNVNPDFFLKGGNSLLKHLFCHYFQIECMGMVSSSTTSTDNHRNSRPSNRELVRRQQEEEEQRSKPYHTSSFHLY